MFLFLVFGLVLLLVAVVRNRDNQSSLPIAASG